MVKSNVETKINNTYKFNTY